MKNIIKNAPYVLVMVLAAACAKDKSVDDYQREKLQENLALYQSVAGTYSGIMDSQQESTVMGAMQLELRAETRGNPSNNGDTSVGTPILVGNIRFLDQNLVSLSANDGFYDPSTGLYSADIEITRASTGNGTPGNQEKEIVKIAANINGGTITGTVHAMNYPGYGGAFTLQKNNPVSLPDQLKRARPGEGRRDDGMKQLSAFEGTTTFDKSTRPLQLVALKPTRGTAEDFLDLVNPVKKVQLSMNYSKSLQFLFPNALIDTRQGQITGQLDIVVDNGHSKSNQQMTIECQSDAEQNMHCNHFSTGIGLVATSDLVPAHGPVKDIPDAPENRQSTRKIFKGRGQFASENKPRDMYLNVTYPARSRNQDLVEQFFPNAEKVVNVSVALHPDVSISFMNVVWDSLNGLLDGSSSVGRAGEATAYIQCHNFFFTESKEQFDCTYSSSRSNPIDIVFKPPFDGK